MRPILCDYSGFRVLAFVTHVLITLSAIVVIVFLSAGYLDSTGPLLYSIDSQIVLVGNIAAPVFIAYRIATAPLPSAVFSISIATSVLVGVLLYAYVVGCNCSMHCNLYLFLTIVVFCASAFACLFPRWSNEV